METVGERVELIALAEAIRLTGEEKIALLKVDIEGAEKELFATVPAETLALVRRVVVEYHDHFRPGARATVEGRLWAAGFSIARSDPVNLTNGILYADKKG
jgi:hypothetical protein